ncbi:MAG: MCP four helix bundle domain-containing protein, partial [Anaeromyxobacteraceae bacterium]
MFSKIKLGQKLFWAFAVAIVVTVAIGTTAYVASSKVNDQLEQIVNVQLPSADALGVMDEAQTSVWG